MASIETQVTPVRLAVSTQGASEVPAGTRMIGLLQSLRATVAQSTSPSIGSSLADPIAGSLG